MNFHITLTLNEANYYEGTHRSLLFHSKSVHDLPHSLTLLIGTEDMFFFPRGDMNKIEAAKINLAYFESHQKQDSVSAALLNAFACFSRDRQNDLCIQWWKKDFPSFWGDFIIRAPRGRITWRCRPNNVQCGGNECNEDWLHSFCHVKISKLTTENK